MPEGEKVSASSIAKRNKYWHEMEDSDKIVKLKDELHRTQVQVEKLCKICEQLMRHKHLDNNIVVNVKSGDEESYGGFYFRVEQFLDK